jgi:glycosyltransferase involved in cell wall biosynthesis
MSTDPTFFGQIRPYKNVPRLIRAARDCADPTLVLFVCGRITRRANIESEARDAAGDDPRVRLELRHIAHSDIQLFIKAADLLVFPYAAILSSGAAMLGLSFDRPVLAPDLGAMAELQADVGSAWVRMYQSELDAAILGGSLSWARAGSRPKRAPLDRFAWSAVAAQTLDAYQAIIGVRHRPAA